MFSRGTFWRTLHKSWNLPGIKFTLKVKKRLYGGLDSSNTIEQFLHIKFCVNLSCKQETEFGRYSVTDAIKWMNCSCLSKHLVRHNFVQLS